MFLFAEKKVIVHQLRDFPEWHRGIRHYGLWCLIIENPAWQKAVTLAQAHMADFLHPGYRRQPHVTLFCCGLLAEEADEFFSDEMRARQADALAAARLMPFRLSLPGHLDSFATAPHLPVADPSGSLAKIRILLAAIRPEDQPPASYHPHITLGFYRESFAAGRVAAHLRAFSLAPLMPLIVSSIHFCRFAAADTQGPLQRLTSLDLVERA